MINFLLPESWERVAFDVTKVDRNMLDSLYDYIENEFEFVEQCPMILQDHPEAREIKPRGENYMSGIFKELRAFFNWAYKTKVIDSFPFEGFEMPSERYNDNIKVILELAGIIYLVTVLDTVTRTEKKVPINEIASSHMARRTFIGNIYKLVKDPNLVSALTGHVEGSRAFNRYRTIDIAMKKDLVKILEGNN